MTIKAREWLNRGRTSADVFNAFGDFWRGFNNRFSRFRGASERDKIRALIRRKISEADAAAVLAQNSGEVAVLTARPIRDMRGNGRDTGRFLTEYEAAQTALARLEAIFMIVYQVRCNLEHGQKSPSGAWDRQLSLAAGKLVGHVLDLAA